MSNHISQIVPLDMLQSSESGTVIEMIGLSEQVHRLQELGLGIGVLIRMIKRGEPSIVAINDQRLSLRLDPGTMVLVEVH